MKKSGIIRLTACISALALLFALSGCLRDDTRKIVKTNMVSGDFKYSLYNDRTAIITAYIGEETAIVIPRKLSRYKVKEIDALVFYGEHEITDIQIHSGITAIGASAFDGTAWLEAQTDEFVIVGDGVLVAYNGSGGDVKIPDGVKYISSAFENCEALTSVTFPSSVTVIGMNAFHNCANLTAIAMPQSVTTVLGWAFWNCTALKSADMGTGIRTIGEGAFYYCLALESMTMPVTLNLIGTNALYACDSLDKISYGGTKRQWKTIEIRSGNIQLEFVNVMYGSD